MHYVRAKPVERTRPDAPWYCRAYPALPAIGWTSLVVAGILAIRPSAPNATIAVGALITFWAAVTWVMRIVTTRHPGTRPFYGDTHHTDAQGVYRRMRACGLGDEADRAWDELARASSDDRVFADLANALSKLCSDFEAQEEHPSRLYIEQLYEFRRLTREGESGSSGS